MSPHFATVALLLTVAQPPLTADDIPAVERPADYFYGAIASLKAVAVRWELSPEVVPFGGPLTLSLVVSNAANPHEISRPPLLQLPGFPELFSAVEDLPNEPPTGTDVKFRYRVKPRNEGTFTLPELVFRSYQPRAPSGFRTQTTRTPTMSFTVTKPAKATPPPVPLAAARVLRHPLREAIPAKR